MAPLNEALAPIGTGPGAGRSVEDITELLKVDQEAAKKKLIEAFERKAPVEEITELLKVDRYAEILNVREWLRPLLV
jgi:hypothetical protein